MPNSCLCGQKVIGLRVSTPGASTAFALSQVCAAPQVLALFQTEGDSDDVSIELVLAGDTIDSQIKFDQNSIGMNGSANSNGTAANTAALPVRSMNAAQHTPNSAARVPSAKPEQFNRGDSALPEV